MSSLLPEALYPNSGILRCRKYLEGQEASCEYLEVQDASGGYLWVREASNEYVAVQLIKPLVS